MQRSTPAPNSPSSASAAEELGPAPQAAWHGGAGVDLSIRIAAALTIALGAIVVVGWAFDLPLLRSVFPGAVQMKANTAFGLIMAGFALLILAGRPPRRQWRAQGLALATAALGLATLAQYALGWNLGLDELVFRDAAIAYNAIPGRMSPYSAVAFTAIGLALAVLPHPRLRPLAWPAASGVVFIGALSLLGYLWNAAELVTDHWLPPVAVNTAVAFLFLGGGILLLANRRLDTETPAIRLQSVETKIVASFVAALALLAIGSGFTYRAGVAYAQAAKGISQTHQVRAAVGQLYDTMSDAEMVQRRYLITGQGEHLDDYQRLAAAVKGRKAAVAQLVAGDREQSRNLADLGPLIAQAVAVLEAEIGQYQQHGFAAARELVAFGESHRLMRAIAERAARMGAVEKALMAERETALESTRQRILVSLLTVLLVASVVFALLYRGIRGQMLARSEAERALVAARDEAQQATRAKSTFLATMSHEIRTPMNGMLGMLELLGMSRLDGEQRATLAVVRESGKSLLRIIDDILDFSRIEAGRLEVVAETASIADTLEAVCKTYAGNASSRGLLIEWRVDPRISPAVRVDPLRLRQILNNLVSNAIKFTAEGTIEVAAELLERIGGEDRIRFAVKDTGIGISVENQRRLFQPFRQAEEDTARRFGGTGLGLAICRRLAEMMGGTIEMQSEPGKGTTMILILSLPIADPKDLRRTAHQGTHEAPGAVTSLLRTAPSVADAEAEGTLVLLADDHPVNRLLLARQAQTLGYAVVSAEDGVEALEKWNSRRFAILVTDCNMPRMDGYELARRIRDLESARGGKRMPIIACTANALAGEAEKCLAAGMDDYLVKPVDLGSLRKKLDEWLPRPHPGLALKEGEAVRNAQADRA